VDILVSNAGGPPAGSFDTVSDEDWRGAFELNLMSVVRLVREALPHMRERGFGRVVNVASSSIKQPIEDLILSNTFRAGVAGLAMSLSSELAPDGILVNTLGPGRISTERSASIDVRGWPCFWLLRRMPEYRSTKRTELRFRAMLTEGEENVRFERVEVGQALDSKQEFLR
jgi:NAD(P)-dependent dehydrogenase (short-subunit alcohol dehydrogenase family)